MAAAKCHIRISEVTGLDHDARIASCCPLQSSPHFSPPPFSIQPVSAKTLRWANDGDVNSMDPYARNEIFLICFMGNIYEPLVRRDRNMEPEPALARRWAQTSPTVWRFHLRKNVKFHDGSPFTADDVVFSFERARAPGLQHPQPACQRQGNAEDRRLHRRIRDQRPRSDPAPGDHQLVIMIEEWAEKNNATKPADLTKNEENFATRNANGTGPFMLSSASRMSRPCWSPNPDWWDKPEHNLTEA